MWMGITMIVSICFTLFWNFDVQKCNLNAHTRVTAPVLCIHGCR